MNKFLLLSCLLLAAATTVRTQDTVVYQQFLGCTLDSDCNAFSATGTNCCAQITCTGVSAKACMLMASVSSANTVDGCDVYCAGGLTL